MNRTEWHCECESRENCVYTKPRNNLIALCVKCGAPFFKTANRTATPAAASSDGMAQAIDDMWT